MRTRQFIPVLAIAVAAIFGSCSKDGATGPQGPQGTPGAQGTAGTNGTNGTNGTPGPTGTANVIYSSWASFPTTSWADTNISVLGSPKRAIRSEPKLTQTIVDNGVVLAYIRNVSQSVSTYPLPWTAISEQPSNLIYGYIPVVGKLIFYNNHQDNSGGYVTAIEYEFRYVLIPGGVSARIAGKSYTASQLKTMPYSDVCKALNIPE